MADGISLEVQRGQREFMPITSLQSMNVRVGDVMSIRSEYGEIYEFQIQAARRFIAREQSDFRAGALEQGSSWWSRPRADLRGSIRSSDLAYRLTQTAEGLQWHYADPVLARPADHGAVLRPQARNTAAARCCRDGAPCDEAEIAKEFSR